MKRILSTFLLLSLLLCLAPAGYAEGESFAELTGLDALYAALEAGDTIVSAYYTDGYGFSTSEFKSTDPDEIEALLEALGQIELGQPSGMSITDWYPQLIFTLSGGTRFGVRFESHWLCVGSVNYELENDGAFWLLTSALVRMYESRPTPVPTPEPTEMPEEPEFIPNCVDLYFPANASTGYSWWSEIEDAGVVALREQYFEDCGELGFVGAGGTQWYHIDGAAEGVTSVVFRYARAWEESALYAFTYRLNVDERGNVLIWGVEMTG